jgi:hypothetical protein
MKVWIDPPSGWRWGFPKIYDRVEHGDDLRAWLVTEGYPSEEILRLGDSFYVRSWEHDDGSKGRFDPGLPIKQ